MKRKEYLARKKVVKRLARKLVEAVGNYTEEKLEVLRQVAYAATLGVGPEKGEMKWDNLIDVFGTEVINQLRESNPELFVEDDLAEAQDRANEEVRKKEGEKSNEGA